MRLLNNSQKQLDSQRYLWFLILSISGVTLLRFLLIAQNIWPFNGDEAQYFGWSKDLAFGYYSKPPMVSWLIALTSKIMGNGIFGIRVASPLCHAVTTFLVFLIGRRIYNVTTGFWSAITYLLLPGVSFSATIISTDPPLLMFWALGFYFLVCALEKDQFIYWLGCGIGLGFGLLSKYAAIFFFISLFLYLCLTPSKRYLLTAKGPYLAMLMALILLAPNLYWNFEHSFVSFLAVKDNANLGATAFSLHWENMFYFLGSQMAVFGPILFATLLWLIIISFTPLAQNRNGDDSRKLLLLFILPLLVVMTLEGLLSRAHGNWAAPGYVTATIAVVYYLLEVNKRWLWLSLAINILVLFGFFYVKPLISLLDLKLPTRMTVVNWPEAGEKIKELRKNNANLPLLIDDRMLMASTMYFGNTSLVDTYKWNPHHLHRDHYDLVTNLNPLTGGEFILVTYQYNPVDIFQYFANASLLSVIKLQAIDGRNAYLFIFDVKNFLGYSKIG